MNHNRNIEDILDQCIQEMQAGKSVEETLQKFPEAEAELRPLLSLVDELAALPEPKASLRGLMRAIAHTSPHQETPPRVRQRWFFPWLNGPIFAHAAATLAIVFLLSWGTITLSANTVPGDLLYPLKLFTERAKFFLTVNTEDKAELRIVFSAERLKETIKKYERGKELDPRLLEKMLEEARQAVVTSVALPESKRKLLATQTAHLSEFERESLSQFQKKLPPEEQRVVARYMDMCEDRADWMRQMPSTEQQPESTIPQWQDMCPKCD